jgi:hypothetical protein
LRARCSEPGYREARRRAHFRLILVREDASSESGIRLIASQRTLVMFTLFHRHAAADASRSESAFTASMPMPTPPVPVTTTAPSSATPDAAPPATYEEILPYLMLAMVSAI